MRQTSKKDHNLLIKDLFVVFGDQLFESKFFWFWANLFKSMFLLFFLKYMILFLAINLKWIVYFEVIIFASTHQATH